MTGFIVKKLRASVQQVMSNALKGIETSNYELEFRTKSNQIRYLLGKQNTGHRSLVYPTHRHIFQHLIRLSHSLVNATTRRDADRNIIGGTFSIVCFKNSA